MSAAQDTEALRLAQEALERIVIARDASQTVSIIQLAILKGMAWERGYLPHMPAHVGPEWPNGCIKRSSCARHKSCMYGTFDSCRHAARDIAAEVEAAA